MSSKKHPLEEQYDRVFNEGLGTDANSFKKLMRIRQSQMGGLETELMIMYKEIMRRRSVMVKNKDYDQRALQLYNALLSQIVKTKDQAKVLASEIGQVYTYANSKHMNIEYNEQVTRLSESQYDVTVRYVTKDGKLASKNDATHISIWLQSPKAEKAFEKTGGADYKAPRDWKGKVFSINNLDKIKSHLKKNMIATDWVSKG